MEKEWHIVSRVPHGGCIALGFPHDASARAYVMDGWHVVGLLLYNSDEYSARVSHLYSSMEEEGWFYSSSLYNIARVWRKCTRV